MRRLPASCSANCTSDRPVLPSDVAARTSRETLRGALEGRVQLRRRRSGLAGGFVGTADLAGDLLLADGDRLEAGGHREQVMQCGRTGQHIGAPAECVAWKRRPRPASVRSVASATLVSAPRGDVEVRLDAIAGRDEHGSTRTSVGEQGRRRVRGRTLGEATEQIEIRCPVRHGDAEQHPSMVRNEVGGVPIDGLIASHPRRCPWRPRDSRAVGGWTICLPPSTHPLRDGRTALRR